VSGEGAGAAAGTPLLNWAPGVPAWQGLFCTMLPGVPGVSLWIGDGSWEDQGEAPQRAELVWLGVGAPEAAPRVCPEGARPREARIEEARWTSGVSGHRRVGERRAVALGGAADAGPPCAEEPAGSLLPGPLAGVTRLRLGPWGPEK